MAEGGEEEDVSFLRTVSFDFFFLQNNLNFFEEPIRHANCKPFIYITNCICLRIYIKKNCKIDDQKIRHFFCSNCPDQLCITPHNVCRIF